MTAWSTTLRCIKLSLPQGEEIRTVVTEFAPLRVRLAVTKGSHITGASTNGFQSRFHSAGETVDVDKALTVSYHLHGVAGLPLAIGFIGSSSGRALEKLPLRSRQRASGTAHQAAAETYHIPIDQVNRLEVSIGH